MISSELRAAFHAVLSRRNARLATYGTNYGPRGADYLLTKAREAVERGEDISPVAPDFLDHGDVIRTRGKDGARRTFVVAHIPDDDMGAPWDEHDGHGPVSDWTLRDKRAGEVKISSDHGSKRFYDFAEACAIARRDEWGLSPEALAELERKAGRKPTARMIAAEAARLDMERMVGWCTDDWRWIGIALIEMPRNEELSASSVADAWAEGICYKPGKIAASVWGTESDSSDAYLDNLARELLSEA